MLFEFEKICIKQRQGYICKTVMLDVELQRLRHKQHKATMATRYN